MKIGIARLRAWFPHPINGLDLRTAWDIITRYYCAPLTLEGSCPKQCEQCRLRIANMMALSEARSPAALLTYGARREAALAKEQARTPAELPDVDIYDTGNPFEKFLESL